MGVRLGFTRCCGVDEIDGISSVETPLDVLKGLNTALLHMYAHTPVPFITFTGVVELAPRPDDITFGHARSNRTDNYGEALAKFIEKHKLGKVVRSSPRRSFSKNVIQVWIWEPDYNVLIPFLDKIGRPDYGH